MGKLRIASRELRGSKLRGIDFAPACVSVWVSNVSVSFCWLGLGGTTVETQTFIHYKI